MAALPPGAADGPPAAALAREGQAGVGGAPGAADGSQGAPAPLGAFFTARRRARLALRAASPAGGARRCGACGLELPLPAARACEACHRRELAWARVRDWVCVHALVAAERAFPLHGAPGPPRAVPCAAWDEDGAADAALAAAERRGGAAAAPPARPEAFGRLSALLVLLPAHLLARVLECTHQGAGEVFAPAAPAAPAAAPAAPPAAERRRVEARQRLCCQYLLQQGTCLHGRVVASGPRRGGGARRALLCWYCDSPGFADDAEGVAALREHAEAEHAPRIAAWVRKSRKVKARQQRDWYRSTPVCAAQQVAALERSAVAGR